VACVTPSRYHWGDYEDRLHASYKNPQHQEAFRAELLAILDEAQERGQIVPPGIAAEYGYAMYQAGQFDDAVRYFQLEADMWPESASLMVRLIQAVQGQEPEPRGSGSPGDGSKPETPGAPMEEQVE